MKLLLKGYENPSYFPAILSWGQRRGETASKAPVYSCRTALLAAQKTGHARAIFGMVDGTARQLFD